MSAWVRSGTAVLRVRSRGAPPHASSQVAVCAGIVVAVLAWNTSAHAQAPGYDAYTDWHGWARLQCRVCARLASSYDRTGENEDYSQYEYPPGLILDPIPCTVKTLVGPGLVCRFWMPHVTANRSFVVKLFFDGEPVPRIDTTSDVVFGGAFAYLQPPLVNTFAGGQVCYEPIPFAQSLRIETINKQLPPPDQWSPNRHYYQYDAQLYPPGTELESFNGSLSPEQQAARDAVVLLFANAGQHPAGSDPDAIRLITPAQTVAPGQGVTLASLAGPGLVRQLNVQMDAPSDADLAGLYLRICYDEDAQHAIDVAVGDFFGAGRGRPACQSLPLGTDSPDGYYCYWPMPFRRSIVIELHNATEAPIDIDGSMVEYAPGDIEPDLCYLHAAGQSSVQSAGKTHHAMLAVAGRGHYVGNLLYVEQDADSFYMLEGDDLITMDGVNLCGTGLEDAYNGGYYYNWVVAQPDEPEGPNPAAAIRPLHGILCVQRQASPAFARADQYRWRIADRVPFARAIEVKMESRYSVPGARWSSVAFWYQRPGLPGDLDCSASVDFGDINPFVLALSSAPQYAQAYPDCDLLNGDLNCDGSVNFGDINRFVACLASGDCECPSISE